MSAIKISSNIEETVFRATADIASYDAKTQQAIRQAVENGVTAIRDQAIRLAPRGPTGNLKAGIKAEMGKTGAYGFVKSEAPHSRLVEFGTGERITYNRSKKAMTINKGFAKGDIYSGKMPRAPFMRPAVEMERPKIEEAIKKVLE